MPGLFNWSPPAGPIGLRGLLAQQFDPTKARYASGSEALLQAGIAMMNPDPHAPPAGLAGMLGRGFAGAAAGADKGSEDFYNNGMRNVQLSDMQRTYDTRDSAVAALEAFKKTPEFAKLPAGVQSYMTTYPEEGMKALADAQLKAQFSTTGANQFGANVIWAQGPDGKYHVFQPDKRSGGPQEMMFPDGISPVPNNTYLDQGPNFLRVPSKGAPGPSGATDVIPKDLAGAESQKEYGTGVGKAKAALPAAENAASIILSSIDSLKSDPYLPNMVGPIAGRTPNVTGQAARVQSKMDQIGGQSFLQAYQFLRGGGSITDVEGQKATAAINRLMTTQDFGDYTAALDELRGIVVNALGRTKALADGRPGVDAATSFAPAGVSQELWDVMTPEERSHWQN